MKRSNSNDQAASETGTSLRSHRVTAGFSDTRKQSAHLTRRTGSRTPRQTNLRPRITVELSNHTAVIQSSSSSLQVLFRSDSFCHPSSFDENPCNLFSQGKVPRGCAGELRSPHCTLVTLGTRSRCVVFVDTSLAE